jgi:hypothetical protein
MSLSFPEDVKYDVEVEMELIKPKGATSAHEMGECFKGCRWFADNQRKRRLTKYNLAVVFL